MPSTTVWSSKKSTVPAAARNMAILLPVGSHWSAGTMPRSTSAVMSQNRSCSAPRSTTARLLCELKLLGTCCSASRTISCTRSALTVSSLLSG